ncbi:hypothetical protein M9H77_05507 [Catharanthus roseus]|uniref:Uncharacterized protein n=1 Tax=Catharanthus roseus TaxID=4058 RepID=A0ACC0CHC1_CATRO|nr:hypothetical protein M9H77_05507 [Catharanthus roseus]
MGLRVAMTPLSPPFKIWNFFIDLKCEDCLLDRRTLGPIQNKSIFYGNFKQRQNGRADDNPTRAQLQQTWADLTQGNATASSKSDPDAFPGKKIILYSQKL